MLGDEDQPIPITTGKANIEPSSEAPGVEDEHPTPSAERTKEETKEPAPAARNIEGKAAGNRRDYY